MELTAQKEVVNVTIKLNPTECAYLVKAIALYLDKASEILYPSEEALLTALRNELQTLTQE